MTHKKLKCFFCGAFDKKTATEDVVEFLGLPMCPYHRRKAAEGFEQGMSEQPRHIMDAYRQMTN